MTSTTMPRPVSSGRHVLQIPGPTNTPGPVLRAIAQPTIDHRGPEFAALARGVLRDLPRVFGTSASVVMFPASGTGAWEAALVNVTSPGDRVVIAETGHFADTWYRLATNLGLNAELIPGTWRRGASPEDIAKRLSEDRDGNIRAVCVVHNETSTGAVSPIAAIRAAMDEVGHDALLIVDTISSLASMDYRHDEWGVDVTVGGSQKGLMLPPGLSFNAVGCKAVERSSKARMPRSYFDWAALMDAGESGQFPYTPATNLIFGLRVALDMLFEEGLPAVFARHARLADATRCAVEAWGLEILCTEPAERSNTLTAVVVPEGTSADRLRDHILGRYNMSLGNGLARLKDRAFRIGHLGELNEVALLGILGGIELGLRDLQIPVRSCGVVAAMASLASDASQMSDLV